MAEQFRTPNAQFRSELCSFHICIMLINSSFNSFAFLCRIGLRAPLLFT